MLTWAVRQPADGIVVAPDERRPWPQTLMLGVQHVLAMFGGTVLCPLPMGFDPNVAILIWPASARQPSVRCCCSGC